MHASLTSRCWLVGLCASPLSSIQADFVPRSCYYPKPKPCQDNCRLRSSLLLVGNHVRHIWHEQWTWRTWRQFGWSWRTSSMHFLWRSPRWGTLCVQLQPGSHTELQRVSSTGVQDTLEVMQGQRQVRASWILYRLSLQRQCSCGLPIWSHRLCTQRLSSQLVKTMNLLSKSSRGGGPVTGPPCLFWAIPVVQLLWLHVRKENVSTFFSCSSFQSQVCKIVELILTLTKDNFIPLRWTTPSRVKVATSILFLHTDRHCELMLMDLEIHLVCIQGSTTNNNLSLGYF